MSRDAGNTSSPTTGEFALVQGEIDFGPVPPRFTKATIYVRLEDSTLADAPSRVVLQQRIEDIAPQTIHGGKVPFAMHGEIPDRRATYTISVLVDVDGDGKVSRGDYINMVSYPVLTHGYPNRVTVRVREVT
jgi:uncharacterized lipoprotein YbaY